MKKQKNDENSNKNSLKNSGNRFSAKRFNKLKESSRYRPLSFLRKNLERDQEHVRIVL